MTKQTRLSICIATYNRCDYIRETLDSIVSQLSDSVELVVVDGASTDDTLQVMEDYVQKHPGVRYRRQSKNSGVDRDYDHAVAFATGDFCWLMTDDDLVLPGTVARILEELRFEPDLLILNSEVRTRDLRKLLSVRTLEIANDTAYGPGDEERMFQETAQYLSFIGAVVVRRGFWLGRDRSTFYGSNFVHIGVLFQAPPAQQVRVLAEPMLSIRFGNASWAPRGFDIWMKKWPALIWSFDHFSETARRKVTPPKPYRSIRHLVAQRALGTFSIDTLEASLGQELHGLSYRGARFIASANPRVMNFVGTVYYLLRPEKRMGLYNLSECESATWFTRLVAQCRL